MSLAQMVRKTVRKLIKTQFIKTPQTFPKTTVLKIRFFQYVIKIKINPNSWKHTGFHLNTTIRSTTIEDCCQQWKPGRHNRPQRGNIQCIAISCLRRGGASNKTADVRYYISQGSMSNTSQLLDITFALILRRYNKLQAYDSLITFMRLFYPYFAHT